MSDKDALLPTAPDYGAVKDQTVINVEFGCGQADHEDGCVSFHDVSYVVSSWSGKGRTILNSVSGYLPKGLNAIMGPTGSGKTSLLDVLAGRKDRSGLTGNVLVNGEHQPNNFKCISGYVVQDDIVMGTLSVRENLHFSAALRLPSHLTLQQRKERVEKVISELGLTKCADTKIGNEFLRGVSGGERKRTNIGMELIIEPQVLFLDEPTTGLDANTAISVVRLLKRLSIKGNNVVIMSIHQPRYSIYKLLDTLTLLSNGNVVYHGPANQTLTYFSGAGFVCEEHNNPADFFLDVVTQCETSAATCIGDDEQAESAMTVDLVEYYQNSNRKENTEEKLAPILESACAPHISKQTVGSYATGFFWQFLVVATRSIVNILRNPLTSGFQWITTVVFALLAGVIFLRLNEKEYNSQTVISNRFGAFFFILLSQAFGNFPALDLFIREKALFIHENVSGFYRVSVFFFAKVLVDLIPMRVVPLCIYSVIAYFMVGFQEDPSKFFIFLLTLTMTSITAASLAFAVGSRLRVIAIANLLVAMSYVLFLLFGGFLIALSSLPVWIQWLKYVSFFRYSLEALSINEIYGQYYCPNGTYSEMPVFYENCTSGTVALDQLGYSTDHMWIWYDQIGLAGLTLIFLIVTYINLLTTKKLK